MKRNYKEKKSYYTAKMTELIKTDLFRKSSLKPEIDT